MYSLLFYCIFLCWGTVFPFNYKDAKSSGNLKYVFVSSVIMCFLFPMVSLVVLKDGYYAANYYLAACTARNPTDFYVTYTLHLSLVMWITTSLFVVIIWTIFKVNSYTGHVYGMLSGFHLLGGYGGSQKVTIKTMIIAQTIKYISCTTSKLACFTSLTISLPPKTKNPRSNPGYVIACHMACHSMSYGMSYGIPYSREYKSTHRIQVYTPQI